MKCTRCEQEKDGSHKYWCKKCYNSYMKEWRANNRDEWLPKHRKQQKALRAKNRRPLTEEKKQYFKELRKRPDVRAKIRASERQRERLRKINLKQAKPLWADTKAIRQIYLTSAQMTASTGIQHHVDHIVPLRGKNVCGLHVEYNLQILTEKENIEKSNSFSE